MEAENAELHRMASEAVSSARHWWLQYQYADAGFDLALEELHGDSMSFSRSQFTWGVRPSPHRKLEELASRLGLPSWDELKGVGTRPEGWELDLREAATIAKNLLEGSLARLGPSEEQLDDEMGFGGISIARDVLADALARPDGD